MDVCQGVEATFSLWESKFTVVPENGIYDNGVVILILIRIAVPSPPLGQSLLVSWLLRLSSEVVRVLSAAANRVHLLSLDSVLIWNTGPLCDTQSCGCVSVSWERWAFSVTHLGRWEKLDVFCFLCSHNSRSFRGWKDQIQSTNRFSI